ncbi:hypothetical protein DVK05_14420 [Halorubrum sp. Atlit-8R]|uniref:hypothetical protein n=1 Tax=unclassified Halorubrum TaxID=2642239 RepID=UPI000EF22BE0|nr:MULTISPECIES: hypothetical protein [unclassified Halorubrum]RLM63473.1 hypothetical protein DVK08_16165 [Halorubrum sp. Atlit-9R]RLM76949.1 hypothetical protein DVK05_14420 [Halorubrum sp. Atlit-8R]
MNRNTIAALAVAIVAIAGLGLAAGGVTGQDGSGELVNDSIEVTNDTDSVYVDVVGIDDMNGSGPVTVNVTFEGLNGTETPGNGTVLEETTLSVAENTTESANATLSDSDRETYDSIHITASTGGDSSLIDTVNWGTVGTGGGAGVGLGGETGTVGIVVVLLLAVYIVGFRED